MRSASESLVLQGDRNEQQKLVASSRSGSDCVRTNNQRVFLHSDELVGRYTAGHSHGFTNSVVPSAAQSLDDMAHRTVH